MLSLSRAHSGDSAQSTLQHLWKNQNFTDVTLVTSDYREIEAQKAILGSCSLFFREIFLRTAHQKPLLYMHQVEPYRLQKVLEFLYKGEVQAEEEDLEGFLELGKLLKIKGLVESDGLNIKDTSNERLLNIEVEMFDILDRDDKLNTLREKQLISCQNCDFESFSDSDITNHNTSLHEDNETGLLGLLDSDEVSVPEI